MSERIVLDGSVNSLVAVMKQSSNGFNFNIVPEDDFSIMLEMVYAYGRALKYASERLKDSEAIVMAAIRNDALVLKYASDRLRATFKIVMTAISIDGLALKFASAELQKNDEIIFEALAQDGRAFEFLPSEIKSDESYMLAALEENGLNLIYSPIKARTSMHTKFMCCSAMASVRFDDLTPYGIQYLIKFKRHLDFIFLNSEGMNVIDWLSQVSEQHEEMTTFMLIALRFDVNFATPLVANFVGVPSEIPWSTLAKAHKQINDLVDYTEY